MKAVFEAQWCSFQEIFFSEASLSMGEQLLPAAGMFGSVHASVPQWQDHRVRM